MSAPVLKDLRGTKTIALPGHENSEVVIYDGVLMDAFPKVQKLVSGGTENMDVDALCEALIIMIKSWNFVDGEGKPVPVTKESINLLGIEALTFLVTEIASTLDAKKKASGA